MKSNEVSGRFMSMAFAAAMLFGVSPVLASDTAKAAGKSAASTGVVAEKAIHADADDQCAKAKADCPKESKAECCPKGHVKGHANGHSKGHSKGADCPKAADCPKHSGVHPKAGESKADPAGKPAAPAVNPTEGAKTESHPG